jgi:hypothetical protein
MEILPGMIVAYLAQKRSKRTHYETSCELALNSGGLYIASRRLRYRISLGSDLDYLSWIVTLVEI